MCAMYLRCCLCMPCIVKATAMFLLFSVTFVCSLITVNAPCSWSKWPKHNGMVCLWKLASFTRRECKQNDMKVIIPIIEEDEHIWI